MAGSITGRAARAALNYMTGKSLDLGVAPQTMKLALLTSPPDSEVRTEGLNEVSSAGYARQNVTWGAAATPSGRPSEVANSANILFGPFTDAGGLSYPATHCALIGTGVPLVGGNLLTANESSVETDVSGWVTEGNNSIARSTVRAKSGSASMASTITAVGESFVLLKAAKPITRTPDPVTLYRAGMWVYAPAAGLTAQVDVQWYDEADTWLTTSFGMTTPLTANGWTEVTRDVTVRNGAIFTGRLKLRTTATAAGQIVNYDQMSLTALSTEDVVMAWQFDTPGQAAQNESLQVPASALSMSLG